MTGTLLALLAVLLAGIGARDQATLAGLVERLGPSPLALATAIATGITSSALAAWMAVAVAPLLTADARLLFAAMALALAGAESLLLSPGRKPREPTRSLGALAIVLLGHQLTDAARFLVFAIAVATAAPIAAGAGGAAGSIVVMVSAWLAPEVFGGTRLLAVRRVVGAGFVLLALLLAVQALL
ncbi:MAG: hypothetical protein WCY11_19290 [Novosphingobium sp.]